MFENIEINGVNEFNTVRIIRKNGSWVLNIYNDKEFIASISDWQEITSFLELVQIRRGFDATKVKLGNEKTNVVIRHKNQVFKYDSLFHRNMEKMYGIPPLSKIKKRTKVNIKKMAALVIGGTTLVLTISFLGGTNKPVEPVLVDEPEMIEITIDNPLLKDLTEEEKLEQAINVINESKFNDYAVGGDYYKIKDLEELKTGQPISADSSYYNTESGRLYERITNIKGTETEYFLQKYTEMYGIPYELMIALCSQESRLNHVQTLPDGEEFNGNGVGVCQIELSNLNGYVSAYNVLSKEIDTVHITYDKLLDLETNIKIGCMKLSFYVNKYEGNLLMILEAYNKAGALDLAVRVYSDSLKKQGINKEPLDIKRDFSDLGWGPFLKDLCTDMDEFKKSVTEETYNNNKKTFESIEDSNNKYGDEEYLNNVLGKYFGPQVLDFKLETGETVYLDLLTMQKVEEEIKLSFDSNEVKNGVYEYYDSETDKTYMIDVVTGKLIEDSSSIETIVK